MSNHTPGPWKIMSEDEIMFGNYRGVIAGKGYLDKQTNTGFNVTAWMSESDARLISCAPELLEALKDAIETAEFEKHPFRPWHKKAKDVIARIEGGE